MKKRSIKLISIIFSIIMFNSCFAKEIGNCFVMGNDTAKEKIQKIKLKYSKDEYNNMNRGNYENTTINPIIKFYISGANDFGRVKKLPNKENITNSKSIMNFGYGFGVSTSIFFNEFISVELSSTFQLYNTPSSSINDIINNYGDATLKNLEKKSKKTFLVPISLTFQYNFAPFGGVSPYIGAGGSWSYIHTNYNSIKIENAFGPVLQLGLNLINENHSIIFLDLKQHFFNSKITFKKSLTGNEDLKSSITINNLVASIGLTLPI